MSISIYSRLLCCTIYFCSITLFLQAQCNCRSLPYVIRYQENNLSKCRHVLAKSELGFNNCPDAYLVVNDAKINGDTIDAPGVYSYSLYAKDGSLICSGGVSLMPSQPVLDSTQFINKPIPFTLQYRTPIPQSVGLLNDPASPEAFPFRFPFDGKFPAFVKDSIPNLGIPFFSYQCGNPCTLNIDFVDEYTLDPCDGGFFSDPSRSRYAKLRRTWLVRGCTEIPNMVDQEVIINRPTRADLHWSLPAIKSKSVSYFYAQSNPDFDAAQIKDLIPLIGKDNLLIGREQTRLAVNVVDKRDTLREGIQFSRTFFIYDNCKQEYLDTFKISFLPKPDSHPWLGNAPQSITISPNPQSCTVLLSGKDVQKMLQTLNLQYNPRCKSTHFSWKLELRNARENYYIFPAPNTNGDYELYSGFYRLYLSSIDSCGYFDFKSIDIIIKVPNVDLNIRCGPAFNVRLTSLAPNGKRIEYISGLGSNYQRGPCGSYYTGTRRIVDAGCLNEYRYLFDFDLDGDGDVLEHFELIRTGPFARMYYTPWRHYIYAFECDEGKPVYFQSYVQEIGGNADTCLGYVNVLPRNNNRVQVNLSVDKALALKNEVTCLPIRSSSVNNLTGIQFFVKFEPSQLQFESVKIPASSPLNFLYSVPGQGSNPLNQLIFLWSYNGKTTVSLPTPTTLAEICFSPLNLGRSAVWVDSLNGLEVVDLQESRFTIKTTPGYIEALEKIGFKAPVNATASAILKPEKLMDIRIFPNPATHELWIDLPEFTQIQGKLTLRDVHGQVLQEKTIGAQREKLDLSDCHNGVHFLELALPNSTLTQRIIVFKP